jgi:hypothetical protein
MTFNSQLDYSLHTLSNLYYTDTYELTNWTMALSSFSMSEGRVSNHKSSWVPTMWALMHLQIILPTERLTTYDTAKWLITTMYALMSLQIILPAEWPITYATAIWPVTNMFKLMCLQTTLLSEWLTPHVTGEGFLPTMCALMNLQKA